MRLPQTSAHWPNTPMFLSYQWLECDNLGNGCTAISGATSQSYVLLAGDVGHTIKVAETASNAGGSAGPPGPHAAPPPRVGPAAVRPNSAGGFSGNVPPPPQTG